VLALRFREEYKARPTDISLSRTLAVNKLAANVLNVLLVAVESNPRQFFLEQLLRPEIRDRDCSLSRDVGPQASAAGNQLYEHAQYNIAIGLSRFNESREGGELTDVRAIYNALRIAPTSSMNSRSKAFGVILQFTPNHIRRVYRGR
jgi:hypothetical protein